MKKHLCLPIPMVCVCLCLGFIACASKGPSRVDLDPQSQQFLDYMSYIILPVERKIFQEMPHEDRGEFIRDFWARRDPDPSTPENEYRTIFYNRLAVADNAYRIGKPGWKTDRGRIYILLGPATNVITKSMGGSPQFRPNLMPEAPLEEGTVTEKPTEIWVYDQYTDWFSGPLRLVFVDYYRTGDYQLTSHQEITAFSMLTLQWDPIDLPKFQWVGMLEMDEKSVPGYAIFDYDASADVRAEGTERNASVYLDIPYERIDYRLTGDSFTCDLLITAEIRDSKKRLITSQDEPYSEVLTREQLRGLILNKMTIQKELELDLPPEGKYIYMSVTDRIKDTRLRKLLETQ
jgi:GWxTD domain-containing protein